MKRLLILGAGQYGFAAREVAQAIGIYGSIEFLDDRNDIAIGKLNDIDKFEYDEVFIAIGTPDMRAQLLEHIGKISTLIHPNAVISHSAHIGEGSIIEAGAVVSTDAKIGKGTIVMANAVVGHNAEVGACCQLKYNCTVPENCVVPDRTKIDCNTIFG